MGIFDFLFGKKEEPSKSIESSKPEIGSEESNEEQSSLGPVELFNQGVKSFNANDFDKASLKFKEAILASNDDKKIYSLSAFAATVAERKKTGGDLSPHLLSVDFEILAEDLKDDIGEVRAFFTSVNFSNALISEGHKAEVVKVKNLSSYEVFAKVNDYIYEFYISDFGSGKRLEDYAGIREKSIELTDPDSSHPREDNYILELFQKCFRLEYPVFPISNIPLVESRTITFNKQESPPIVDDGKKVPCNSCGKEILPRTAQRTGGLCMPCWKAENG